MQHPNSVALLSAIYVFTLAAAGGVPRGVGPEFVSHYQGEEFSCITNAAIKLSLDRINDNTCDCPDGSDEPGTAACANLDPLSPEQPLEGSISGTTNTTNALPGFWCENKGHIGMYVPFSYVNDGVCDYELCCDGSEEYSGVGGVKCQNKCAEIGKEHRRLEDEKRKNLQKAAKKRGAMVQEAKDLRQKVESKVEELKKEIAALEVKKEELAQKHREAEQQDKGKVVREGGGGGKLGVLVGLAKTRVNELRNTLDSVVNQRDALKERVGELEELLTKFKTDYNPNFNDEGVKAAIRSFEDYSARQAENVDNVIPDEDILNVLKEDGEGNGVNWSEFEEGEGSDTDILYNFEAYLPPPLRAFIHNGLDSLRVWAITNGILADNSSPGKESTLVRSAREAVESATRDLSDKKSSLDVEQADLNSDFGPDDIFRALKGKCVSIEAGEYTYEQCWLENTKQKSKKGHGQSNMGNFKRIDREMADDEERIDGKSLGRGERMVLKYEDGQQCWNGPQRRTDVWLGCAETEELWRVSESEKCVYKMEIGTPAACDFSRWDVGSQPKKPRERDEL
ncbi:protein kinase C substrate 80K-H [Fusarium austroafricanum]|uniref:Glucosidase 2 subunit beta n=1 Tax=Fusarium austroafricanum TaxID=2364996 RepID=A0A8H4NQ46_9HYPO|nr:protein kinase C substrate 80K-H [Fusarium austroafricanum]